MKEHREFGPVMKMATQKSWYTGLFLIRSVALLAIFLFHTSWSFWVREGIPPSVLPSFLCKMAEVYTRVFSLSGPTLVYTTACLYGMKGSLEKAKLRILVGILCIGWCVFSVLASVREGTLLRLVWDIYPLWLVGVLAGGWILKLSSVGAAWLVFVTSLVGLSLPYWEWAFFTTLPSLFLQEVLVGRCPEDYADWPVLPWVFLIFAGFAFGRVLMLKPHMQKAGWLLGLVGLLGSSYFYSRFYHTPLGVEWACFMFRQNPLAYVAFVLFLSSLIWVSLLHRVDKSLRQITWAFDHFQIFHQVPAAYCIHYALNICAGALLQEQLLAHPWIVDGVLIGSLILTELILRSVAAITMGMHIRQNKNGALS